MDSVSHGHLYLGACFVADADGGGGGGGADGNVAPVGVARRHKPVDGKDVHFVDDDDRVYVDEAAEDDAAEGTCTALQVFHATYGVLFCAQMTTRRVEINKVTAEHDCPSVRRQKRLTSCIRTFTHVTALCVRRRRRRRRRPDLRRRTVCRRGERR